jgi:hypothetical protein
MLLERVTTNYIYGKAANSITVKYVREIFPWCWRSIMRVLFWQSPLEYLLCSMFIPVHSLWVYVHTCMYRWQCRQPSWSDVSNHYMVGGCLRPKLKEMRNCYDNQTGFHFPTSVCLGPGILYLYRFVKTIIGFIHTYTLTQNLLTYWVASK